MQCNSYFLTKTSTLNTSNAKVSVFRVLVNTTIRTSRMFFLSDFHQDVVFSRQLREAKCKFYLARWSECPASEVDDVTYNIPIWCLAWDIHSKIHWQLLQWVYSLKLTYYQNNKYQKFYYYKLTNLIIRTPSDKQKVKVIRKVMLDKINTCSKAQSSWINHSGIPAPCG